MTNKTKNFIIGTLVLALVCLLAFNFFSGGLLKKKNNVADMVSLDTSKSKEYKDDLGRNHTTKEVVRISDESKALLYKNQLDSVKKQLGIEQDRVRGITTAIARGEYTFIPDIKNIEDSLRRVIGQSVEYKTRWIDIKGSTIPNTPWKVRTRDSLTMVFSVDSKYGLFKNKEKLRADLYSENKDMEYLNIRSWQVPEAVNNKAKVGFGLTAGPGIQFGKDSKITYGLQLTGGIQFRF